MNESIKFRAYDYKKNKLLNVIEMDWYPDHALRYLKAIDKDGKEWYYDSPDDIENNLIIEQFTGLKDKDGKEIYEGDIIHFAYNDNDFYSVVVFDNGKFYGKNTILPNLELRIVSVGSGCHFISPIEYYYYDMYISGDIHDNPELLEADK